MTATPIRERAAHLGPQRRRPQVLDTALVIATETGLNTVTIGAVADRMGVTRPVVYSCFPSRVALVDSLLDRETAVLTDSVLVALHGSDDHGDPEAVFVEGFRGLLHAAAARPASWRLMLDGRPDPAIAARFQAAHDLVRASATAWIAPAMRTWWQTRGLDRKLPVLIDFFMASCESAIGSLIAPDGDWTPDELGEFLGRAVHRAFCDA